MLGASFEKKLISWILLEQLSQRAYKDDFQSKISYYRTAKGSLLHFIIEDQKQVSAIKVIPEESFYERDLLLLENFSKKISKQKCSLIALAGNRQSWKDLKIEIYPWEAMG